MRNKIIGLIVGVAALGALGGVAAAGGTPGGSRLDDGKQLLAQANVTEQRAIVAAQGAAQGDLNEIDLERYAGKLVFNVDVGANAVKVDAASGEVLAVVQGD